jgi:hypothetical protein
MSAPAAEHVARLDAASTHLSRPALGIIAALFCGYLAVGLPLPVPVGVTMPSRYVKPCHVRTTGDDNPFARQHEGETGAQTAPPCVRARDHSAAWRRYALMIPLISARQEPQFVPACRACPIASTVRQPALAAAAI